MQLIKNRVRGEDKVSKSSRSLAHRLDRMVNTPGASQGLLTTISPPPTDPHPSDRSTTSRKRNKKRRLRLVGDTAPAATHHHQQQQQVIKEPGPAGAAPLSSTNSSWPSGHLLRMGIKFSSQDAFLRFMKLPVKHKRGGGGKKRPASEIQEEEEEEQEHEQEQEHEHEHEEEEGWDNPAFQASVMEAAVGDSPSPPPPLPPPRKKRRGMDMEKLRTVLNTSQQQQQEKNEEVAAVPTTPVVKTKKSVVDLAREKLTSSRFRYLNEQLYSQPSSSSLAMFRKDPALFPLYHQGYQLQAKSWPLDPLDTIIAALLHLPSTSIVADMGCGEARLARSIPNKVHSFDLVAATPGVTECDMSKVPLESASVDVVVFCLSLMGSNIRDFLQEAARILRPGGILKVAELESRFYPVPEGGSKGGDKKGGPKGGDKQGTGMVSQFIKDVEKFGFTLTWKDLNKEYFYFMDFERTKEKKCSKKKLPHIELKPCLYKKR